MALARGPVTKLRGSQPLRSLMNTMRVAVCIATYQRPEQLKLLLDDLAIQNFTQVTPTSVAIVIADNDPGETARTTVEALQNTAASYPYELHYIAVPERGVVHARNAAVELAHELDADWMAFIDDDERPVTNWLGLLLDTAERVGASSVAGPVPERFSFEPPSWYIDAGLHCAESFPTGSTVKRFGVGNLLVSASALRDVAEAGETPFDLRFNATGGEDVFLGFQLAKEGHQMVWCDEAIATTEVPEERTEFRWVMRRQYNAYRNYSRALRLSSGSQPWPELAKSLGRLAEAAGRILFGAVRLDKGAMSAGAYLGAGALGKFAGTTDRQDSGWWD